MNGAEPAGHQVPIGLHLKTRLMMATRPLWMALANLESRIVADEIESCPVAKPVYVTGIARAGTTIVTEMLAQSLQLTSHQYADFPFLFTPYWRNWLAARSKIGSPVTVERAHRDRINVSTASPEAFEEVLWMAFDRDLHAAGPITPLDPDGEPDGFLPWYLAHIRKLVTVRQRSRYLAKGNYNLLRLRWLVRHMDNPRIVLMVRDPFWHVASLIKQHELFMTAQQHDHRTGWQLSASGHFEFGPRRRATGFAGASGAEQVEQLWAAGEQVRGWARLWAQGYQLALDAMADPLLAKHLLLVRYEDLCSRPADIIGEMADHCELEDLSAVTTPYLEQLSPPDYYAPGFGDAELAVIADEAGEIAETMGY